MNNIHPAVAASHGDLPRLSRHSGGNSNYPAHPQGSQHVLVVENGLTSDPGQPYPSSHSQRGGNGGGGGSNGGNGGGNSQSQPSPSIR